VMPRWCACVALVALPVLATSCIQVDRDPPPGVRIVNRTDARLKVFSELPDGSRVLVADLSPGGTGESTGPCVRGHPLVAETLDGQVVGRYGPFDQCDRGPWIIRPGVSSVAAGPG
jgi:hypothetical protein